MILHSTVLRERKIECLAILHQIDFESEMVQNQWQQQTSNSWKMSEHRKRSWNTYGVANQDVASDGGHGDLGKLVGGQTKGTGQRAVAASLDVAAQADGSIDTASHDSVVL